MKGGGGEEMGRKRKRESVSWLSQNSREGGENTDVS